MLPVKLAAESISETRGAIQVKLEGNHTVEAGVGQVWDALEGTEAYKACMPAITRLEEVAPDQREAVIDLQLPAISGVFEGSIEVVERDRENPDEQRIKLKISGSGKPGVIDGTAEIILLADDDKTNVKYAADVQVGGQIARLGQRMIGAAAQEMAVDFFGSLSHYLATGTSVERGNPILRAILLIFRTIRALFSRS